VLRKATHGSRERNHRRLGRIATRPQAIRSAFETDWAPIQYGWSVSERTLDDGLDVVDTDGEVPQSGDRVERSGPFGGAAGPSVDGVAEPSIPDPATPENGHNRRNPQ
jgi:hypothetical protein